ncbi:MAG: glycosyltransferase family 2 protein [Prolixibacteraceae bacterium]|nr:glycosyltransferase family 2 protein [Prolixibacteraceae bacterium]
MIFHILFWFMLITVLYTYAGYRIILYAVVLIKRLLKTKTKNDMSATPFEPEVCLFVTAYNESDYVSRKVANSFALDYDREKIEYLWVTDGSDDGTPDLLKKYPALKIHHQPQRRGKIDAMNRGMQFVKAPVVIFSDSNAMLSPQTIRVIVERFANPEVGCVAGEKRIVERKAENASAAGEGLYWKTESKVKKLEAEFNSTVGGVGELFAIRTALFNAVEKDTILDDFIISLRIALQGYKIDYAPDAYAEEVASLNVREELKRKTRIAAGGIQAISRLPQLLNPFKQGALSWQYFSHKVLRWTLAPLFLFLLLPVNIYIVAAGDLWFQPSVYSIALGLQWVCYALALAGGIFENRKIRSKLFFAPFYFVAINYASLRGIFRYCRGKQNVTWEKSKRAG